MARLEDRPFNEFVTVKAPRGQRQNISSARQAAEWLLFRWPKEIDTAKARAARKACLDALEGQREAAAARQAFRAAAEEAGILIGDERRPTLRPVKRKRS
jgi:hypothetical protein